MTDLWNNNEFINDNALTVNISRLRNKLQDFGLENKIETRRKSPRHIENFYVPIME